MSDYFKELETGVAVLEETIEKYKGNNKIEIELRLGRINNDTQFSPGILSLDFFNKIKNILENSESWDKIEEINTRETINKNGIRKIEPLDLDNKNQIKYLKKNKIEKFDFYYENTPFDIRLAIAEEDYLTINKSRSIKFEDTDIIRYKNRKQFYYKESYVIDLTEVKTIINTVETINYEVEVELLNLKSNMTNRYRAHSALLLIRDIINMCETIDGDAELLQLDISNMEIK
jgi:hypothetical protein